MKTTKKSFLIEQNRQIKKRQVELLNDQISKLVNSNVFELSEIFQIFWTNGNVDYNEFLRECKNSLIDNGSFIIDSLDLIQEHELKTFCGEKGIKI